MVVTGEGTTVHTTVVLPVTSLECVRSLSAYLLSKKILFHAKNSLVKHQRHPSTASSCGGFACVVHTCVVPTCGQWIILSQANTGPGFSIPSAQLLYRLPVTCYKYSLCGMASVSLIFCQFFLFYYFTSLFFLSYLRVTSKVRKSIKSGLGCRILQFNDVAIFCRKSVVIPTCKNEHRLCGLSDVIPCVIMYLK